MFKNVFEDNAYLLKEHSYFPSELGPLLMLALIDRKINIRVLSLPLTKSEAFKNYQNIFDNLLLIRNIII